MPNRTSYSEALNHEVFRTISSTPETSSFQYVELPKSSNPTVVYKWLLPGEEVKIEEPDVGYLAFYGKVYGRVFVTNYRLRFEENRNEPNGVQGCSFDITLGSISRVEKLITCKDMRNVKFLHRPETHSRRPLYDCLQKFAFPILINYPSLQLYITRGSTEMVGICTVQRKSSKDRKCPKMLVHIENKR
uniref:Uncharacterized protein n=1 Tax=Ditylenchus dipsaci TaxID=166011 RepID=A0A915E8H9_9BILA